VMEKELFKSETNRIEFKQQLTDDIEKEVCAFLNYHEGGLLYIGIDKKSNIVGVNDIDNIMLKIKDRLKNNIMPSCMGLFDIISEEYDGKNVIKIIVASGPEKPYYLKKYGMSEKGTYIRIGTAAEPMPAKIIEQLFSKRTRNSIGKIKAGKQKLSFEQLKIYYEAAGLQLNDQFAANLELLTEEGDFNYVAYLLSDANSVSIKVAKYQGTDRVDLIENNEYGYCSLIKAAKQVLDKLELENKTLTKITFRERENQRLWSSVALRESAINAIVHNDFSREVPPKFEIFSNRIEITSAGGLTDGMTEEEFFEGYSMPRNKEIMRVFKDLDLVEYLGSGVPRILKSYGKECFRFSENFLRMSFPSSATVTPTVTPTVIEVVKILFGEMSRIEIQNKLNLLDKNHFLNIYLKPAMEAGVIEMTIPDKPNSRLQKYRLTLQGIALQQNL
jgi:ATP-dependent DNA helicase RecG